MKRAFFHHPAAEAWLSVEVQVEPDPFDGELVRGLQEETDYKATRD